MDAVVGTLKFENKAVIPTDPRTKLFLTVTVSTIMITGGTGGFMNLVRPCLMACPIVFLLLSRKWGGRSQICSYIRYFVCVGINGITAAHGHMEFYLGSRSRDLYAHAPRIYHGILSGEYDNGQRICCSDGEDAHSTKNRDSYVGGIPIFPHSQRGIYSHSGRYEDAWHHYLPQSHEDAGIPDCSSDDVDCQNRRRTVCGCSYARAWSAAETDEYM